MEANQSNASQRLKYLITKLQSSQPANSFRALVEIRTKYFAPKSNHLNLFIQEDGLKHLVAQLQKGDKKIVDVSLSILGHCVLEQEPRILFRKAGGLPVLAHILRSAHDGNIQSRACRALGSLIHDRKNSIKFIELSVQDSLCHILGHTENEETLCMALRAVKHLADCKEHVAAFGRCYLIPKLWVLLTVTENENVLKNLLTTLCHICGYMQRFSESSAHYWVGPEGGGKFVARLVILSHSDVQSISTKAMQLFQQIIQDRHVRPFLTGKEAFESLIPVVMKEKESNRRCWTIYMTCLLLLCRENPNVFRQANGIPVLLHLIRQSDPTDSESTDSLLRCHHTNIFSTLLAFKNDTESLAELADGGIIDILLSKIVTYIESSKSSRGKQAECLIDSKIVSATQCDLALEFDSLLNNSVNKNDIEDINEHRSRRNDNRVRFRSKRQYRTTSPSYQAVELEYDQLFRYRESSSSDVLNIFGWNSNTSRSDLIGTPSSPQSLSSSLSPNHSTWSDYGSDADGSDFPPMSPTCMSSTSSPNRSEDSSPVGSPTDSSSIAVAPNTSRSSSESDESEEEDNTICYSPANFDLSQFESPGSSPAPPPGKRARGCADWEKLCCESDLKMSWLHLGQVEGKDFYENWPEFSSENRLYHPVEWAIYLLHRLSWMTDTPRQLTDQKLIKTVVDYLTETSRPTFYACRILFRLSSHPDLFVSLLRAYFPLEIYSRLVRNASAIGPHCCPLHSSLRRVGEQIIEQICEIVAQFGRGEMENVLLKGKEDAFLPAVALATPVIVRSRCLLRRFLIELDVLETIWSLLRDEHSVAYAAAALSSLGNFLKMDDLLCPLTDLSDLFDGESCRTKGLQDDVFFQISLGQSVGAIKDLLQVPFFQAMFNGNFSESSSTIVPLPNIDASVLKAILHVIYGCGRKCESIASIDRLIRSDQFAVGLLQSIDRFLLLQYSERMCNLVGSQDWSSCIDFPGNYIALFKSLGEWHFPLCAKLRNHLLFFPFSDQVDCPSRIKLIKLFLSNSSIAEHVIDDWKTIFLGRIEDH